MLDANVSINSSPSEVLKDNYDVSVVMPCNIEVVPDNLDVYSVDNSTDQKHLEIIESNISTINNVYTTNTDTHQRKNVEYFSKQDDTNNNTEEVSKPQSNEIENNIMTNSNTNDGNDNIINSESQKVQTDVVSKTIEESIKSDTIEVQDSSALPTKPNANISPSSITQQLLIQYLEGQWSPINQDGKKFYSIEQMYKLKDNPKSKEKPKNLPENCEVSLKDIREYKNDISIGKTSYSKQYSSGNTTGNENNLLPAFAKSNLSQRGGSFQGKRSSQQGNKQQPGNKNSSKSDIIQVSLSLREDIKLNESENAWKPTHRIDDSNTSPENQEYQKLLKSVRGILNKLTPEKFQALLNQLKELKIDTPDKLKGVIELIFEKAVDEPNFAVAYSQMCSALSQIKVPKSESSLNFRTVLLNICQKEFEKIVEDHKQASRHMKIEDCKDLDKKLELEEEDRKLRRRSVGTIRFIGELFKCDLLTPKILLACIQLFLDRGEHEESLECLCKLLSTVGRAIYIKKLGDELNKFILQMEEIVNKKSQSISSRVRFMLQDVIDLKKSHWVPRRQDLNPRKMGDIVKEAETEQFKEQLLNYSTTRKEDRRPGSNTSANTIGGGNMSFNKPNRGGGTDDGWQTPTSKNRSPYSSIDTSKFNSKPLVSFSSSEILKSNFVIFRILLTLYSDLINL